MTHGSWRDFLLHLGDLLCAAERQSRAAARQPSQLSQRHCLTQKRPLADLVRIKLEISTATTEYIYMCVDRVQN